MARSGNARGPRPRFHGSRFSLAKPALRNILSYYQDSNYERRPVPRLSLEPTTDSVIGYFSSGIFFPSSSREREGPQ